MEGRHSFFGPRRAGFHILVEKWAIFDQKY